MHRKSVLCGLVILQGFILQGLVCVELHSAEGAVSHRGGLQPTHQQASGLGAQPCAVAGGFHLVAGCCECAPGACDNAWDGYCEQKARWQAFWARLGTPRAPRYAGAMSAALVTAGGSCRRLPPVTDELEPPELHSLPAAPLPEPEPTPVPAKPGTALESSRRPWYPTMR